MKILIVSLLVSLLAITSIAYAQSARDRLRADPAIQSLGLSDVELDRIIKRLTDDFKLQELQDARAAARNRIDMLLSADANLKRQLIDERKLEVE